MAKLQITGIGASATMPSAATDGVSLKRQGNTAVAGMEQGFCDSDLDSLVFIYNATVTAGQTATMSYLRLWGYHEPSSSWVPIGVSSSGGSDADRGKLNSGVALAEIAADKINFCQVITGLGCFQRVFLEEGTSGGSGYASTAWLQSSR